MSVIRCDKCGDLVDTDFDVEVLFCNTGKCTRTLCSVCTDDAGLETESQACDLCAIPQGRSVSRGE